MVEFPVNDADGHITETTEQLRPYFDGRHGERGHWAGRRSYYPEDGWDRSLGGQLGSSVNDAKSWLKVMDDGGLETAVLYPTAGLAIGWVREPDFAVALCRAYNNFVQQEFLTVSPRLKAVALLPFQDVPEAVKELRRAVTELGMSGAFAPAVGLRLPLGHPSFHPIYAEAERLGSMVACHATVRGPHFFGADGFDKFVEVHALSHPVAQMIQLTGMIFEGVPEKYPSLRIGFMEAGCSWLPFWMDRMDEEWSKRKAEAPLCRKKPSDYLRSGQLFFAAEGDEKSVPEVIRRLNLAPGGTAALVRMRQVLLSLLPSHPELQPVDDDFVHLFSSWFNRGFLVLRPIDWNTSASILEKIIRYEAVHAIQDWDDLRNRLEPSDRRCYAFFHPQLIDEPLIFVEVALTREIPGPIGPLLDKSRHAIAAREATTAVFYSISNCQRGLAGVSFGHFLIKQVVEEISREAPKLSNFVTLSPAPNFAEWLRRDQQTRPEEKF